MARPRGAASDSRAAWAGGHGLEALPPPRSTGSGVILRLTDIAGREALLCSPFERAGRGAAAGRGAGDPAGTAATRRSSATA